jgi:hypothetical protein
VDFSLLPTLIRSTASTGAWTARRPAQNTKPAIKDAQHRAIRRAGVLAMNGRKTNALMTKKLAANVAYALVKADRRRDLFEPCFASSVEPVSGRDKNHLHKRGDIRQGGW